MDKFLVDGRVTSVMLFLHLINRSISEGGLVAGGLATQSGRQNLLLHSRNLVSNSMLTPRIEEGKPRMIPLHIEMVKGAQCKLLVRFEARAG